MISSSWVFIASTIYHILNCISLQVATCCYKIDLLGITYQLMNTTVCCFFFMYHNNPSLRRLYIAFYVVLFLIIILFSTFDCFVSTRMNTIVMVMFNLVFVLTLISGIQWVYIGGENEISEIYPFMISGFILFSLGLIVFLTKFPECLFINYAFIDMFFHSHFIWHFLTAAAIISNQFMIIRFYHLINS